MAYRLSQGTTSFQQAAHLLLRTAHLEVSKETLRQLVEAEGRAVLEAQRKATLLPDWSALDCTTEQHSTRVYLGCDGVKLPLVTDAEKQQRRAKIRAKRQRRGRKSKPLPRAKPGTDNAYKEFKVATSSTSGRNAAWSASPRATTRRLDGCSPAWPRRWSSPRPRSAWL